MQFVKKFFMWIIILVALSGLIAVQFTVVASRDEVVQAANRDIREPLKKMSAQARGAGRVATAGDQVLARKKLLLLQTEGGDVRRLLYEITKGLNVGFAGANQDTITIPGDKQPLELLEFSQKLVNLYGVSQRKMAAKLRVVMKPRYQQMIADDFYFGNRQLVRKRSNLTGVRSAEEQAAVVLPDFLVLRSRIIPSERELSVKLEDNFDQLGAKAAWVEWRKYLIDKDILLRVVPQCFVRHRRTVNAQLPLDEKTRLAKVIKGDASTLGAAERWGTQTKVLPGYRFIQQITKLTIEGPEFGNNVLPAVDEKFVLVKKKSASRDEKKRAGRHGRRHGRAGEKKAGGTVYYDKFTVTIELFAHPSVIKVFQRMILKGKDIYYIPVSAKTERLRDSVVMGVYRPPYRTNFADEGMTDYWVPQKINGFSFEEGVKTTLVYYVYRYRFADTNNAKKEDIVKPSEEPEPGFGSDFN